MIAANPEEESCLEWFHWQSSYCDGCHKRHWPLDRARVCERGVTIFRPSIVFGPLFWRGLGGNALGHPRPGSRAHHHAPLATAALGASVEAMHADRGG